MRELPKTLSDVITLCVKVDEHLRACGRTDVIEQGNLRADPAKVQAVVNWPTPSNHRQLQSFLVFANFFCRVIRDYSRLDLPLTCLTSPMVPFCFTHLKKPFASAPILIQPNLSQPFVMEVDASDAGVGTVLPQQQGGKLHPCAYFSRCLYPAEKNYDMEDRELLAIKLALEEWCHWLEGAAQPSVVWTDHKTLFVVHPVS